MPISKHPQADWCASHFYLLRKEIPNVVNREEMHVVGTDDASTCMRRLLLQAYCTNGLIAWLSHFEHAVLEQISHAIFLSFGAACGCKPFCLGMGPPDVMTAWGTSTPKSHNLFSLIPRLSQHSGPGHSSLSLMFRAKA